MTTTADLIESTKRLLLSGQNEPRNRLAAATSPGTGTLVLDFDVSAIGVGSTVQVDLELFYVWAVDPSSKTLTVEPAQQGSTAAAHDDGDIVVVNPKFPDFVILQAINDDLADLSSPANGLFRVRTVDLTFTQARGGYDLTGVTDLLEVHEVRYSDTGLAGSYPALSHVQVGRNLPASDYASGNALFIEDMAGNGRPMVVTYKAPFAPLTTLSDNVATVSGLPTTAMDLPPMGAAVRLVAGREIRRNFTDAQGDSRRSAEVGAGAVQSSWRGLEAKRQSRIVAEAARLAQTYPARGFTPVGYG